MGVGGAKCVLVLRLPIQAECLVGVNGGCFVRIRRGPQGRSVLDGTADDRQAASAATFCRCQFQGRSS